MAFTVFCRLLQFMKLKPPSGKPVKDTVAGVYRNCVFLSSPPGIVFNVRCVSSVRDQNVSAWEKKQKLAALKITLVGLDGNITVVSLEDAQKIAKRRDLKLVKVGDADGKTERPIYKIMTDAQYFEEDLRERKTKADKKKTEMKGEKLLTVSDKIGDVDLNAKLKMVRKWLEKKHEENVMKKFETVAKECGKLVQKRQKGREIKFSILPNLKAGASEETNSEGART